MIHTYFYCWKLQFQSFKHLYLPFLNFVKKFEISGLNFNVPLLFISDGLIFSCFTEIKIIQQWKIEIQYDIQLLAEK